MMKNNLIEKLLYVYIIIPIIIFLYFWCKPIISLPLIIMLCLVFYKDFRFEKDDIIKIKNYFIDNYKEFFILLLLIIIITLISGLGGYFWQNDDHLYRNGIFETLVNNGWPITMAHGGNFTSKVIFVYYFAFWLPAASVGKLFGINFGYFVLMLWTVIGLCLLFQMLKKYSKKSIFLIVILFFLFSGLDIVEKMIYGADVVDIITKHSHIEWLGYIQYSSFTTQLFWVFNQAIPAWLITLYVLNQKYNNCVGIIVVTSLLYCTLPALSIAVITIYKVIQNYFTTYKKMKSPLKIWIINTFTWENLLVAFPLFIVLALFVKSNTSGGSITFGLTDSIDKYLVSIFFEFAIYYILIFKYQLKKPLLYISFIILLICPFVSINSAYDFCMRVSIPMLIILFCYILEALDKAKSENKRVYLFIFYLILLLGAITPINEFARTLSKPKNVLIQENKSIELITSVCQTNFFGYADDSIFYKYIMRKHF